jgi:hypothetical protein
MKTLLEQAEAMESFDETTWQWSDRSSLTNLLMVLINKAPSSERHVIVQDLAELLRK